MLTYPLFFLPFWLSLLLSMERFQLYLFQISYYVWNPRKKKLTYHKTADYWNYHTKWSFIFLEEISNLVLYKKQNFKMHKGHVKNNEAPPKSTYQGHLFGSGVFWAGLENQSGGSFFMFRDHFVTLWLHYFWHDP